MKLPRLPAPARRRGFTLVELIVVLVVLGVLIALLVPALTGYIRRAGEKRAVAECRQVVTAAQATASEAFAKGGLQLESNAAGRAFLTAYGGDILDLAERPGGAIDSIDFAGTGAARIGRLVYTTRAGVVVVYELGGNPLYRIQEDGGSGKSRLEQVQRLMDRFTASTQRPWEEFKALCADKVDSALDAYEKKILKNDPLCDNLKWKPAKNAGGELLLIATTGNTNHNAGLVYWNGSYYYHLNYDGSGFNTNSLGGDEKFNTDALRDAPPSTQGGLKNTWVKYVP